VTLECDPAQAAVRRPSIRREGDGELHLRSILEAALTHTEDGGARVEILAESARPAERAHPAEPAGVFIEVSGRADRSSDPDWLIGQTSHLRNPVFRTRVSETAPSNGEHRVIGTDNDGQLILGYAYDELTELHSTMGELNVRDMLVMCVVQQAFFEAGCPSSCVVGGPRASLAYIARQIGMSDGNGLNHIKASIERLVHSKVKIRFRDAERAKANGYPVTTEGYVKFGFLQGYGVRTRSRKGMRDRLEDSYLRLDQTLGDLIRGGHFTFLRKEVIHRLRDNPTAVKLYAWARTHEPTDRGVLFPHRVSTLANKIGCADTNASRRRKKVLAALDAVCRAAPDEFPSWQMTPRTAKSADPVIELRRNRVRISSPGTAPTLAAMALT
jgi:hypothetical protein